MTKVIKLEDIQELFRQMDEYDKGAQDLFQRAVDQLVQVPADRPDLQAEARTQIRNLGGARFVQQKIWHYDHIRSHRSEILKALERRAMEV